jgi:phosphonate transport system substrate-binding protein
MLLRRELLALAASSPLLFACGKKTSGEGGSTSASAGPSWPRDGSKERPLAVMLIPADGGTEDGTKRDFLPLFGAVTTTQGLVFDVRVGQSYGAVVEAMANGQIDVAFFGPVSYMQAKKRAGAELLAVSVEHGSSTYFSGIFVASQAPFQKLSDLRGKALAVGDPESTSSFAVPLAMLLEAGVDPVKDLGRLVLAGSHVNALVACTEGRVDAAAASFLSFEKAVGERKIPTDKLRPIAKSEAIPNPPLAMHPGLPKEVKAKLREGFSGAHKAPGISPEQIRGYGGRKVDRYDVDYPDAEFLKMADKLQRVDAMRADLLKMASQN